MSDREKFIAILPNGPVLPPDAIVVLCGEDAEPRMNAAAGRFYELSRYAEFHKLEDYRVMLLLSGGKHEPPRWIGAKEVAKLMLSSGVAHDRILLDSESQNTREQAVNVVDFCKENDWRRIMLVASPYHMYRAFLTFLRALQDRDMDRDVQIVPMASDHTPWFSAPEGVEDTRIDLMTVELTKCQLYSEHVATFAEGLDYLEYWETVENDTP